MELGDAGKGSPVKVCGRNRLVPGLSVAPCWPLCGSYFRTPLLGCSGRVAQAQQQPTQACCYSTRAQVKLPAVSSSNSSSRTGSPARPWKPAAPGALSPGIAGSMPMLTSTSPSPSNASPMLRHTLSARGAATAGAGEYPGRLLSLQEDSQLLSGADSGLGQYFGGPGSPIIATPWLQQQLGQYGGSSNGGGYSNSAGAYVPRVPGSNLGGSYLGGLAREGTESPSRPRRAISAPGSQLQQLALQHATQQKVAGVAGACDSSSTSSPRYHHPSSLAARVGHHPNFTNIALDVNAAAAAAAGPEGHLAGAGPTPGSACDTPDSQSSPHVCPGLPAAAPVAAPLCCISP